MKSTHLVYLLVILLLSSCSNPYKQAVERGENALKGKRFAEALFNYEQACQMARKQPDDACRIARELQKPAEEELFNRYKVPCEQGQPMQCIEGLSRAPQSIRDTQRLLGLRTVGGTRHLEGCRSSTPNDVTGRIRRARCAASADAMVNEASYRAKAALLQREAADAVVLTANQIGKQYPGAEVILYDAAQQLFQRDDTAARLEKARAEFLVASAAPLRILMSLEAADGGHGDIDVCARLQPELGNRVRCHASGALVQVRLSAERSRDRMWTEDHSQRYQAGVRRVPNPAFPGAEVRVLSARREVTRGEEAAALAIRECADAERDFNATPSDPADKREEARKRRDRECARKRDMEDRLSNRKSELRDAESHLRNTPPELEEPVYETHYWTSRHYEWTMGYAFSLEGLGTRFSDGDTIVVRKMEQPGFPPAGIEEMRIGPRPSYRDLVAEADARVAGATLKMLTNHLNEWGKNRSRECPEALSITGPWLECQAETALWAGRPVDGSILLSRIQ